MKISALVHFSYPWRCAGSETVLQELLKAAADVGHDVHVYCTHETADKPWTGREPDITYEGIRISRHRNVILAGQSMIQDRPDAVVSHHQHVMYAIRKARVVKARSVFLIHNDYDLNGRPLRMRPDLVIFNADHTRDTLTRKFGQPREALTFHPPLTPDRHEVLSTGDALTLVNLNRDKGADLFYTLARQMPERRFIGVVGAHGVQVVKRDLPNVQIIDHTPDMRTVWGQTRILLMPSIFESYGLVAQEAGLNGIPTIAHPTAGLRENLGTGGLFADRDQIDMWAAHIRRLDDPGNYSHASRYALSRADEALTATRGAMKRWLDWLGVL